MKANGGHISLSGTFKIGVILGVSNWWGCLTVKNNCFELCGGGVGKIALSPCVLYNKVIDVFSFEFTFHASYAR